MNINQLHAKLVKKAKENKEYSVVGDTIMPVGGALVGIEGGRRLGWYDKIDNFVDNKEAQRIANKGEALKKKHPNLDLEKFKYRASKHLDHVRSKQNILRRMLSGSNKYTLPLMLALGYGGGTAAKSIYDRLS